MNDPSTSLQTQFQRKLLSMVVVTVFLGSAISIGLIYRDFFLEAHLLRSEYIDNQKRMLKREVDRLVSWAMVIESDIVSESGIGGEEKRRAVQEKMISHFATLRFEEGGYFFGSTFHGEPLFSNGKITMGTESIWDLTDPDGVKIIQEQQKVAQNPDGGFVRYRWRKLDDDKPIPKLSYVRGVPDWQWTVGAGVYLDRIEQVVEGKKVTLFQKLKERLLITLALLGILLMVVYFWSQAISRQIKQSMDTFILSVRDSGRASTPIDPDRIDLTEFKEIAHHTNQMIKARTDAEEKLRQSEAQIQQAQKMESIGSLAGGIAHDFNNILFPIMALSELMMTEIPKEEAFHQNLMKIRDAGQRGSQLVQQILAFSRQSEDKRMPVLFNKVLNEVIKLCRSTIPADIPITSSIDPNCGFVMANPTQLHQIAMNLITNAFHAVESTSGAIDIQLKTSPRDEKMEDRLGLPPGNYVTLIVSDTGSGIDAGIVEKIFDPYFTTKEKGKGTGLGLAVVHGIVKGYGGAIDVESHVGKGTRFSVYLPVVEKAKDETVKGPVLVDPTGHERILYVDDDPQIAEVSQLILERLGYDVTLCTGSIKALEHFKASPDAFDLVITDMTMPNMTGDRLAKAMLTIRPDLPIIVCTGFSERIDMDNIDHLGVKGVLMKPVALSDMAEMVRRVLDNSRKGLSRV